MINELWDGIINTIYPRRCPVCANALPLTQIKELICKECKPKLTYISGSRCFKCGKPLEGENEEYCYDCTKKQHIYERGMAVWAYDEYIKKSMYLFKYHNQREYADFYGKEIARLYGRQIKMWDCQALIPVPLYKDKYKIRGYNQAFLIADRIGKELNIKVDDEILLRVKSTKAQKELDDKERYNNLKNAFQIGKNDVQYKRVIVIDDIYTTGATIDSCAKVLKEAGVLKVYYLSVCIGYGV